MASLIDVSLTDDCVVRINQEELGYLEDEYEDLKALFQMFDFDQVHNLKSIELWDQINFILL